MLKRLREEHKLTIVLVEQNLDFIANLAERVLIIQKGQITQQVESQHLSDAETMGEFTGFTASKH